jgi:hypothetical protein
MTDDLRTQLESKTDDELIEMLADRDSGDYRPEAIAIAEQIVAQRGIALPVATAEASDQLEFTELVQVAGFMNHIDAETCLAALRSAGFDAIARDASTLRADNLLAPMLGGVRLVVPPEQADEARAFLQAVENGEVAASASCPACGSDETAAETRSAPPEGVAEQLMSALGETREHTWFRCRACGHEWQ